MSSVSLILLAMFTTANVAGPGGQHIRDGLSQPLLWFLILSVAMAATAAYAAIPRGRRSYPVARARAPSRTIRRVAHH